MLGILNHQFVVAPSFRIIARALWVTETDIARHTLWDAAVLWTEGETTFACKALETMMFLPSDNELQLRMNVYGAYKLMFTVVTMSTTRIIGF